MSGTQDTCWVQLLQHKYSVAADRQTKALFHNVYIPAAVPLLTTNSSVFQRPLGTSCRQGRALHGSRCSQQLSRTCFRHLQGAAKTNAVIVFRDGSAVLGPLLGNYGYVGTTVATVEHNFMSFCPGTDWRPCLSVCLSAKTDLE